MLDLGYPAACRIDRVVFKKMFHDAGDLSKADRTLLTDNVDKVIWTHNLRRENTMIPPFQDEVRKYEEIQVIQVKLRQPKGMHRLTEIIMRAIPYPMLLFFEYQGRVSLALAHQRNSLVDSAKNTLEEVWLGSFLAPDDALFSLLRHDKQRLTHFYDYYGDLVDTLCRAMARQTGASPDITGEQARMILKGINSLDSQMVALRAEIKRESRFNRKVELNMQIKQLEQQKQELLTAKGGQR